MILFRLDENKQWVRVGLECSAADRGVEKGEVICCQ